MLVAIPHDFFAETVRAELGVALPPPGGYAVSMVFFPVDDAQREACREIFESVGSKAGYETVCWRRVPTDNRDLGKSSLGTEPVIEQWFIKSKEPMEGDMEVQVSRPAPGDPCAVTVSEWKSSASFQGPVTAG